MANRAFNTDAGARASVGALGPCRLTQPLVAIGRHLDKVAVVLMTTVANLTHAAGVEVTLAPVSQTIMRGERPRFIVTVVAKDAPVRILRFAERGDFRANYARLVVTRDGKPAKMLQVVSDPGPAGDGDYVMMQPGEALTFQHDGEPFVLSELPAATYSVVVKLSPDWRVDAVNSNSVSFTVEQR